jgi:stage V sporulation protein SpoVS
MENLENNRKEEMKQAIIEALNVQDDSKRVPKPYELKVGKKTTSKDLKPSICRVCKEYGHAEVRAIGDAAIGVGVRGAAMAIQQMYSSGYEFITRYAFWVTQLDVSEEDKARGDDGQRTGFSIIIEGR